MYEIFISCKSEDYDLAKGIYNFLCEKGYSVFIADVELQKLGRAKYGKVIDEALEEATHLILFSSSPNYVTSTYVEEEWRTFLEEQRCGRKKGNLLTVRKGFDIADFPISLRNLQSFTYDNFQSIIDYLPLISNSNNGVSNRSVELSVNESQLLDGQKQEKDLVNAEKISHKCGFWSVFLFVLVCIICVVCTISYSHNAFDYEYPFVEGMALVEKNGKYGFIDSTEKAIIPLEYDFAWQFYNGWAMVKKDNKYGFINKKGEMVIDAVWDFALDFADNGLAVVYDETVHKYGFIN